MKKFRRSILAALRALLARGLAGAMALAIFFESCTRYDLTPREEVALAEAQRRAARDGGRLTGSYDPAIRLSPEDRAFRDRLNSSMRRASESPEAARAILAEQAVLGEGDAEKLDGFTLSLVRVMGDAELQAAMEQGDKEAIVSRLMALRGAVKIDEATRAKLRRIAEEYGVDIGNGGEFVELAPSVFFTAGLVFIAVVVALVLAAVSVAGAASALTYAASEAWVLGTEDKLIPTSYGGDAALVMSGLKDHNLRRQVEEELDSRYAQEVFEYLQYVYPDENAQHMHALSESIVNSLMGRKSR